MSDLYLVTLGTYLDDLPIGVCQTISGVQSLIRANAITPETCGGPSRRWPHAIQNTLDVSSRDLGQAFCWNVWEIKNGVPTRMRSVEPDGSDLDKLFKPDRRIEPPVPERAEPDEPAGCPVALRLYESPQEEWDSPGCGPVG